MLASLPLLSTAKSSTPPMTTSLVRSSSDPSCEVSAFSWDLETLMNFPNRRFKTATRSPIRTLKMYSQEMRMLFTGSTSSVPKARTSICIALSCPIRADRSRSKPSRNVNRIRVCSMRVFACTETMEVPASQSGSRSRPTKTTLAKTHASLWTLSNPVNTSSVLAPRAIPTTTPRSKILVWVDGPRASTIFASTLLHRQHRP